MLLEDEPERVRAVVHGLLSEAEHLTDRSKHGQNARRFRVLMAAHDSLAAQLPTAASRAFPRLTGLRLDQARQLLERLGLDLGSVQLVDALRPESGRSPVAESRWVVRGQLPGPGETVPTTPSSIRLLYSRPHEQIGGPQWTKILELGT
jgi:hypothetical protein